MTATHVFDVRQCSADRVAGKLKVGSTEEREIFFNGNGYPLSTNLETFVCLALLPAMQSASTLVVSDGEISDKFLLSLGEVQDIFSTWKPELKRVCVKGPRPAVRPEIGSGRVGVFFSGGVDSFFTLFKHEEEITDLIFIHGFDIGLEKKGFCKRVSGHLRDIAKRTNKNLIEIESNFHSIFAGIDWNVLAHGAALASVGQTLSSDFSKLFIPATYAYDDLLPWASHPLIDHLWSTESLQFVHDGCEADRVRKVAVIAESQVAMDHLRVCFSNPDEAYNCGKCEKCLRTMVNLEINGALKKCRTFDSALSHKELSRLVVTSRSGKIFIRQNIKAIESQGGHERLKKALLKVLRGPSSIQKIKWRLHEVRKRLVHLIRQSAR